MELSPVVDTDASFIASRLDYCFNNEQVDTLEITLEGTLEKLPTLPVETISYLAGILRDENFQEESDYALDRMLIFMLHSGTSVQDIEDIACVLATNEMILMQSSDYFEWDLEGTMPTDMLRELIAGLRWYEDADGFKYDKTQPIRRQGQKVIDQCNALLEMALHLEMVNEYQLVHGVTVVPDYETVELVAEFPERLFEIIAMMEEQEYESTTGIREVLTGEVHRSLAGGIL
jgi:hypothetical protein